MLVFISHQQRDSTLAVAVSNHLKDNHGIATYLDVTDKYFSKRDRDLTAYIKAALDQCSHLLAVVSQHTATSWWVPWEIGVATEKTYPIATYSSDQTPLPDYLKKWPYLRNAIDLDRYARIVKQTDQSRRSKTAYMTESRARSEATQDYYASIRAALGQ